MEDFEREKQRDMTEKACCINYEMECFRLQEQVCKLSHENEKLKKALLNIALKLGD